MRLSFSRLDLAAECLWPFRPEVEPPAEQPKTAADLGTALHAVAEVEAEEIEEEDLDARWRRVVLGEAEVEAGKGLNDKAREALSALAIQWREWWDRTRKALPWHAQEVAFAINTNTGGARVLPKSSHRDYSTVLPHEVPGTCDLVAFDEVSGLLTVYDYKTGQGPHNIRDHMRQMSALGTAAGRAYGAHSVRVVAAWVTPDGVKCTGHLLDSWDMTMVLVELRSRVAAISDSKAVPGLHCEDHWCKARAICPETRALLLTAGMSDGRHRLPIVGPPKNNEQAHAKILALRALAAWTKQGWAEVKEYSDARPIVAPDGREYGPREVEVERPMVEVKGAEDALVGLGLVDAIERKVSTSWAAIEKAIRAHKQAGAMIVLKDENERAREALREIGAIKVSRFNRYDWRKGAEERRA